MKKIIAISIISISVILIIASFKKNNLPFISIQKNTRIALIGNNLGSRMMDYDYFETEMHLRYPGNQLVIRNMCDGGNTPGFRPHSARNSPWAFDGAEKFQTEFGTYSNSEGHFDSPDKWLERVKPDVIIAFFGLSESYQGETGLENYKAELDAFIKHSVSQKYNGISSSEFVLVSPIAFENLSLKRDLPNGITENQNIEIYTNAMKEIASKNKVKFVDAFNPSKTWFQNNKNDLTIDGLQLNDAGYQIFGEFLANQVFGESQKKEIKNKSLVKEAVQEKNWMWHNDIKVPNGVHVYGRRFKPFGNDNYPNEII